MNKKILKIISIFTLGTMMNAWASDFSFPQKISYQMEINGRIPGTGNVTYYLRYNHQGQNVKYYAELSGFSGAGIKTDNLVRSFIAVTNGSPTLHGTTTCRDRSCNDVIYQAELTVGRDFDMVTKVPVYKSCEGGKCSGGAAFETTLAAEHSVIDLLTAFVVTAEKVRKNNMTTENYYMFLTNKTPHLVEISFAGQEAVQYAGQKVQTSAISVKYHGREMFHFNIYQENGKYFPVRVASDDDLILTATSIVR